MEKKTCNFPTVLVAFVMQARNSFTIKYILRHKSCRILFLGYKDSYFYLRHHRGSVCKAQCNLLLKKMYNQTACWPTSIFHLVCLSGCFEKIRHGNVSNVLKQQLFLAFKCQKYRWSLPIPKKLIKLQQTNFLLLVTQRIFWVNWMWFKIQQSYFERILRHFFNGIDSQKLHYRAKTSQKKACG